MSTVTNGPDMRTYRDMRTAAGKLKAPPYPPLTQNRPTPRIKKYLKPAYEEDLIDKQFEPEKCRERDKSPGSKHHIHPISDRALEKRLDQQMKLSTTAKRLCEEAKAAGNETFIHVFGENTIEVFFRVFLGGTIPKATSAKATLDEVEAIGVPFQQIRVPPGGFYVALDGHFCRLFVLFGTGFEDIYGPCIGKYILELTTWNIEEYAAIHPPSIPSDQRHTMYEQWLLENPHFCWPEWARCGVYHWGQWMEQGHTKKGSVVTNDSCPNSNRVKVVYSKFTRALGNVTRAKRVLLGAIDSKFRDLCQKIITTIPEDQKKFWATEEDECFALRACLINVFTEPHRDSKDLANGWALMAPMGDFTGGDFCITELKRRFVFLPGSIGAIRGARLEHFTLRWRGTRYSLVSTIHNSSMDEYKLGGN